MTSHQSQSNYQRNISNYKFNVAQPSFVQIKKVSMKRRKMRNKSHGSSIISKTSATSVINQISKNLSKIKNKRPTNKEFQTIINLRRYLEGRIKSKKNTSQIKTKGRLVRKIELVSPSKPRRNKRERVLSEEHASNKLLLSTDEIISCNNINEEMIAKFQKTIHEAKLARFRGFVSPYKLNKALVLSSRRKNTAFSPSKICISPLQKPRILKNDLVSTTFGSKI